MQQFRAVMLSLTLAVSGVSYAQKYAEEFVVHVAPSGPSLVASQTSDEGIEWSGQISWPGADYVALRLESLVLAEGDVLLLTDGAGERMETLTGPLNEASHWSLPFPGETIMIDLIGDGGSNFVVDEAKVVFSRGDNTAAMKAGVESVYRQLRAGTMEKTYEWQGVETKVIYGLDGRREVYEETDPRRLLVAQATTLVAYKTELTANPNGSYTIGTSNWTRAGGGTICADEPYRGQPTAGFCSGFLVGPDLLLTAGHCVNLSSSHQLAFIFDYKMQADGQAPSTTVSGDSVYFAAEVLDRVANGTQDHALVRLDRTVVNRQPLNIRREGTIAQNDPLFVVGHPAALPMKIASGANVQNALPDSDFFQANLDTYGGNSGSPVVNMSTFLVEGILVRGAPDYRNRIAEACVESNRVDDTGNTGSGLRFEEVSKLDLVGALIPELVASKGTLTLDRKFYRADDAMQVIVRDVDIRATERVTVTITSEGGLNFTAVLIEDVPPTGIFRGTVLLSALPLEHDEVVTVTYNDADDGTGSPSIVQQHATIDLLPPVVSDFRVSEISANDAIVRVETNEESFVEVHVATECGAASTTFGAKKAFSHSVFLSGLTPLTTYYVTATATDVAGHVGSENNGGECYVFRTRGQADYFTEIFSTLKKNELVGQTITFTPANVSSFYGVCRAPASQLPTDPTSGTLLTLNDDDAVPVELSAEVELYGVRHGKLYVGSNGYITFVDPDTEWDARATHHFSKPRVAPFFNDFDPSRGGEISWQELSDRVVVTWLNVPLFSTSSEPPTATFQAELFHDGRIALTNLNSSELHSGIVGLSRGFGIPPGYGEGSELNGYPACIASSLVANFDFTSGAGGWEFISLDGIFTPAAPLIGEEGIGFATTNNSDSFSIWHVREIPALAAPPNRLYKASFSIRSDQSDPRRVPTIRMRTSGDLFEESHVLNVTSQQDAGYSPGRGGYEYSHFFTVPPTETLRVAFDVISTNLADAAMAQILMETLTIQAFNVADLMDERFEMAINPATAQDWSSHDAREVMNVPIFAQSSEGLSIQGSDSSASEPIFGYWSSPVVEGMQLQEDRIYRVEYTVASSATSAQRQQVPSFRLRINDDSLMSSAYIHVESMGEALHVPVIGAPRTYSLFYLAPPAFTGRNLIFGFDYLWTPESEDDPNLELTLANLQVRSYSQPF